MTSILISYKIKSKVVTSSLIKIENDSNKSFYQNEKLMETALRTSNLVLPQGFVEMDREEMMYVDGGWTLKAKVKGNANRWACAATFAVLAGCYGSMAMYAGSASAGLFIAPDPTFLTKVFGTVAAIIAAYCANMTWMLFVGAMDCFEKANKGQDYTLVLKLSFFFIPTDFYVL